MSSLDAVSTRFNISISDSETLAGIFFAHGIA
jgi:hypothetical protein